MVATLTVGTRRVFEQHRPGGRERQLVLRTVEQQIAQLFLQRCYAAAQRRLRKIELLGRLRDVQVLGDDDEFPQGLESHVPSLLPAHIIPDVPGVSMRRPCGVRGPRFVSSARRLRGVRGPGARDRCAVA